MRTIPLTKKASENQFYIPAPLLQRLTAMPLLLENTPFDFAQLTPELHIYIASFVTSHSMSNLSITCTWLHEKLTFQTPGIWNIVTHSIIAISEKKLPELLLKANLCERAATNEQEKLFYTTIKEKVLSSCNYLKERWPYQYLSPDKRYLPIYPFSSDYSKPLLSACYTGDKNIVTDTMRTHITLSSDDLAELFWVTIDREKINIIPLLCQSYATSLESEFLPCKSHSTYLEPASKFDWNKFAANIAITNDKKKSFKSLIIYYKQYLNIIDKIGTYLDFIVHAFGNKKNNDTYNKNYQQYAEIVMLHGGKGMRQTISTIVSGNKTEK